jgi:lipopolysaccharide export system ATP-binding protein
MEDRMPILEAEGLVKTYGSRRVVDGVSFSVDFAEIVGLLGPNGAGKTTSFRMTCGMIEPDQGTVILSGIDVTRWPMYRRAKEGRMGYLAQESSVFRKLTVEQNLLGVMELLNMDRRTRRARCDELLEQFSITHLRKSKAGSLSGGERRRLEIARCLVSEPEIILLDEPFTGIDPVTIENIQKIIRDLKSRGISILITDHQVRETLQITDRSYVVHQGRVLCHGSREEVLNNPQARELYFGSGIDAAITSPLPLGEDGQRPGEGSPTVPRRAGSNSTPSLPVSPSPPPSASPAPIRPTRRTIHEADTLTLDD